MEAEVDDELVALDPDAGNCFGFNNVATSVWWKLDKPKSFDELRNGLLEEYDVSEEQCSAELRELLEDMQAKRLVERVD